MPQDAQAQLNYGKALHEAGRVQEALVRYENAIARKPTLAEAEFYLGLALSDLGEGIVPRTYERALSPDPKNQKLNVMPLDIG